MASFFAEQFAGDLRVGDTFEVVAPFETCNNSSNFTTAHGQTGVILETDEGGSAFVKFANRPAQEAHLAPKDWVRQSDLVAKAKKVIPRGARCYIVSPLSESNSNLPLLQLGTATGPAVAGVVIKWDGVADPTVVPPAEYGKLAMVGGGISYRAEGGGVATIPAEIRPFHELGLDHRASGDALFRAIKGRYRDAIAGEADRQRRALLSLCYDIACTHAAGLRRPYYTVHQRGVATYNAEAPLVMAAVGQTRGGKNGTPGVMARIRRDETTRRLVRQGSGGRGDTAGGTPLLYKAARAGFFDLCKALIAEGADVNQRQRTGSTALHAACFYGHRVVVELLLSCGADPEKENDWRNTAVDEAHPALRDAMPRLLAGVRGDVLQQLFAEATAAGFATGVRRVEHGGRVVAQKLFRKGRDGGTVCAPAGYRRAWHGTKAKYVQSILQHGIKPSGSRLPDGTMITPPSNHYALDTEYAGVQNWANAIFVSPSVAYAAHACYAERVMSAGSRWAVVMETAVRAGSYKTHESTVRGHAPLPGEPTDPEYRVAVDDGCSRQIMRIGREQEGAVVVTSATFILVDFLEGCTMAFEEMTRLLSPEASSSGGGGDGR